MSSLIQYFSITKNRRAKREKKLAEEITLSEAKQETLLEAVEPLLESPVVCTPELLEEAPSPASPQTPPEATVEQEPDQTSEEKPEEVEKYTSDIIGFWIIRVGREYLKLPIQSEYVISRKIGSFKTLDRRNEYPALALLATWKKLVKAVPSYKRILPKGLYQAIKEKDYPEIENSIDSVEHGFLRAGCGYYLVSGGDGILHVSGSTIPPFWDALVSELSHLSISSTSSFRFPKPKNIRVGNYVFDTDKAAEYINDYSIKTFSELSKEINKSKVKDKVEPAKSKPEEGKPEKLDQVLQDSLKALGILGYKNLKQNTDALQLVRSGNPKASSEELVKGVLAMYKKNESGGAEATNSLLLEVTFRKLMSLTQQNGDYVNGGLVKVGDVWVTDPRIRGRIQNSYFVVTKPPKPSVDEDGLTRVDFNFKSKPDRSTTGMRQKGYVKFVPPSFLKKKLQKAEIIKRKPANNWSSDVSVKCSCPDFKYRYSYLLAQAGASPTPTGQNGDATNSPPVKTNPRGLLSLCKHLAALAGYLATTKADLSSYFKYKQGIEPTGVDKKPKVVSGADVDDSV